MDIQQPPSTIGDMWWYWRFITGDYSISQVSVWATHCPEEGHSISVFLEVKVFWIHSFIVFCRLKREREVDLLPPFCIGRCLETRDVRRSIGKVIGFHLKKISLLLLVKGTILSVVFCYRCVRHKKSGFLNCRISQEPLFTCIFHSWLTFLTSYNQWNIAQLCKKIPIAKNHFPITYYYRIPYDSNNWFLWRVLPVIAIVSTIFGYYCCLFYLSLQFQP